MAKFGKRSLSRLETCHGDLQIILHQAISTLPAGLDMTIIFGRRTPSEQFKLFKKGRIYRTIGKWVITDKSKIVTYKDGYKKRSRHNYKPSLAVDVAPYPIDWKNINEFFYLAGHIMAVAKKLYAIGGIDNKLEWGGRWRRFKDYPHFQLKFPVKGGKND